MRDVALSLGCDLTEQFAAAGISEADLDPTANKYMGAESAVRLLERCADVCEAPDFGLRVGEAQDFSILGPIALAMAHAPTGRAAFEVARVNLRLINLAWRISMTPLVGEEACTFISVTPVVRVRTRAHSAERALIFLHRLLHWVIPRNYAARAVWIEHASISPLPRYVEAFGVTPAFDMPTYGIAVSDQDFDASDPDHHEGLFGIAKAFLEREFPIPVDDIVDQVRVHCERALLGGECTQRSVAAELGLHERTLQRRLQARDATFEQIKDEARKELALRYIARRDMSLSEVSVLLGYAESSALSRACQRWFGASPRAVRKQMIEREVA